jgi:hypothetical protein
LIDVRVLFYYGYKGGTGLITKGELDKDTLKISTKGEFFYIRTGTNYKGGTTEVWLGPNSDGIVARSQFYLFDLKYVCHTGISYVYI